MLDGFSPVPLAPNAAPQLRPKAGSAAEAVGRQLQVFVRCCA